MAGFHNEPPIKVGVIGAGNMGRNHLRVLASMPAFSLTSLYDPDAMVARQQAAIYGITACESLEQLYDSVDAVHVVSPSFLHAQHACMAADAGCHLLVEKPIALTLEDADAIIAAARQNSRVLCVGHVERYNPAIVTLKDIVAQEEVLSVDFQRLSPYDGRIGDANVVYDLMIHDLDVLNWLMPQEPARVNSHGVIVFSNQLDYAQAIISYESGTVASLTASRITESKVRKANINTRNAYINVDYLNRSIEISRKTRFNLDVGYQAQYLQESIIEKVFVPFKEPLVTEFEEFARCIHNGDTPATNGETARKALMLCEQITKGAFVTFANLSETINS